MNSQEKKFSVSQLFSGSSIFYNFTKEKIEYGIYDYNRTVEHFETEEIARLAFQKIYEAEQARNWGCAKSVTLWENDKKIEYK